MEGAEDADSASQSASEVYNRAFEKYQARHWAEARELFHQYIEFYPDSVLYKMALYYLGHCHQMLGDLKEARVLYSRVVDTYGDDDFWGAQAMKRLNQIRDEQ